MPRAVKAPSQESLREVATAGGFSLRRLGQRVWHALAGHFRDPGAFSGREIQGYITWAPVVLAILTVEALGAFWDAFHDKVPTISSTVGHLETRWDWIAVIVVALIAITAFLAVAYRESATTPPHARGFSLAGALWDGVVFLVVIILILAKLSGGLSLDEHQMGYTVYGVLFVFGLVVPGFWALGSVDEPTLFSMVRSLRARLPWVTVILITGLTILLVHLAFYPWPNIAHTPAH